MREPTWHKQMRNRRLVLLKEMLQNIWDGSEKCDPVTQEEISQFNERIW